MIKQFIIFSILILNIMVFNVHCNSRNNSENKNNNEYKFKTGIIEINSKRLNIEVADTPNLRSRGLMYRKELGKDNGMLFIFKKEQMLSFWMKNTYIPLDIAFIDKNGVIFDIFQMQPLDESSIRSTKKGLYALEMNQGWFKRNSITVGHKMKIIEIEN